MSSRTHAERLKFDLDSIREELTQEIAALTPEELDWAPKEGMKSFRALLVEIGTMERICLAFARERKEMDWMEVSSVIESAGSDATSLMRALAEIRAETLAYLAEIGDEGLETPISLAESWRGFFGGAAEIEPEVLIRWIARHEYYHIGQIITYRWIRGNNPYQAN